MFTRILQTAIGLALSLGLSVPALAQEMAPPTGAPLLTISGDIAISNVGDTLVLDQDMLMSLPVTSFETSTIWTNGIHSFTGVSLADLAAVIGIKNGKFLATAINDYTVEIPVLTAQEGGPIIAYLMDGQKMSVRDKGPLWVVYPYDSDADYRAEVIYARSIWQLDRLEIVQ